MTLNIFLQIALIATGVMSGYYAAFLTSSDEKLRAANWGNLILTTNKWTSRRAVFRRARFLTAIPFLMSLYLGLLLLFLALTVAVPALLFHWFEGVVSFISVFLFTKVIYLEGFVIENYGTFTDEMIKIAIRKVIRNCSHKDSIQFLNSIAAKKTSSVRLHAIQGFALLPKSLATKHLRFFIDDHNKDVASLFKRILSESIRLADSSSKDHSKTLYKLIHDHNKLRAQIIPKIFNRKVHAGQIKALTVLIDNQIRNNFSSIQSKSSCYCRKCHSFAERTTYTEWVWIRCRKCLRTNTLEDNIHHVIGKIGGASSPQLLDNKLEISLWKHAKKEALFADINILQIDGEHDLGEKTIDFDWAINAVLESLEANGSEMRNFRVVLKGEPSLSQNSIRLLKEFEARH